MTDEQMRIKIAEACGWTPFEKHGLYLSRWTVWNKGNESKNLHELPDYLNDLNAMHEAEKMLRNQFTTLEETYWRHLQHVQPHPIYATARQRAEAFIKTLGL